MLSSTGKDLTLLYTCVLQAELLCSLLHQLSRAMFVHLSPSFGILPEYFPSNKTYSLVKKWAGY